MVLHFLLRDHDRLGDAHGFSERFWQRFWAPLLFGVVTLKMTFAWNLKDPSDMKRRDRWSRV